MRSLAILAALIVMSTVAVPLLAADAPAPTPLRRHSSSR